ncbi:MAG: DUF397 domain-containing protein [Umezawaea sp.]
MTQPDPSRATWRKSSRSGQGGESCVELACAPGVIAVRDSKNPTGGALAFGLTASAGFLNAVKSGRFDT